MRRADPVKGYVPKTSRWYQSGGNGETFRHGPTLAAEMRLVSGSRQLVMRRKRHRPLKRVV
eukprot:1540909-Rhodomonas_salina.2